MKVLFVVSGNAGEISPIVKSQGDSLINNGIKIEYFLIQGNGLYGYLKNIPRLRECIKLNHFDIVHAHYSLTAFTVSLTGFKPLVVSMMGSDLEFGRIILSITRLFSKRLWNHTIVKSEEMAKKLNVDNVSILPNGVDIDRFKPLNPKECKSQLDWLEEGYHILFAANPKKTVKNYSLFENAVLKLRKDGYPIHIHVLDNIPHDKIPIYMNAAEVVCLSSFREGSPNVIKEAMACNCPLVVSDVGDAAWVINKTEGCYVSGFSVEEYTKNLNRAIEYSRISRKTNGHLRIKKLKLNSNSVAQRVIKVYKKVLL